MKNESGQDEATPLALPLSLSLSLNLPRSLSVPRLMIKEFRNIEC